MALISAAAAGEDVGPWLRQALLYLRRRAQVLLPGHDGDCAAGDCLQSLLAAASDGREIADPWAYACRALEHCCQRHVRCERVRRECALASAMAAVVGSRREAEGDGENGALGTDELRERLERIHPIHAQALRLRYLAGFRYETMSAVTGRPQATLRTHVRRGLLELRELLVT